VGKSPREAREISLLFFLPLSSHCQPNLFLIRNTAGDPFLPEIGFIRIIRFGPPGGSFEANVYKAAFSNHTPPRKGPFSSFIPPPFLPPPLFSWIRSIDSLFYCASPEFPPPFHPPVVQPPISTTFPLFTFSPHRCGKESTITFLRSTFHDLGSPVLAQASRVFLSLSRRDNRFFSKPTFL